MKWRILGKIKKEKAQERRREIIEVLLKNRGLKTPKQQKEFLEPKNPLELNPRKVGISSVQINKAINLVKKAIRKQEKIVVYGDYDTDGICATAIMWEALYQMGAKVMPYIPRREEGYGLKIDQIDQMAEEGVKLIVTVDQGIVHSRQVKHARKIGVKVIITDHHVPGKKLPPAQAIIHTTKLAGSGVAWFLVRELTAKLSPSVFSGLDLAAIGTVTDMVPLLGPNRSIVKFGVKAVRKTKRPGLIALFNLAMIEKQKIGPYELGFIIGPRLNAAGRMEDPMEALRLVCTQEESRALMLAQKIDGQNRKRQDLMKRTTQHAREIWLSQGSKSALIYVHHQEFSHGVIGLVASKLKEEFYRPAVVLGPRGDHWVASARSIEEFSIVAAIRELKDIIGDHGGHRLAAGFSVNEDRLEEAGRRLIDQAEAKLDSSKLSARLKIDAVIGLEDVNFGLFQQLVKFEPFGKSNPQPVFATQKAKIIEARTVGRENKHLKLRLASGVLRIALDAIAFNLGRLSSELLPDKPVDIAYNLNMDEWNGRKRLQLRVKDIHLG